MVLETERLFLREMNVNDFDALCMIMQDEETMTAYEGVFSDHEVQTWLENQLARYKRWKFGLWAVVLKENGEMIGQCGLTMQPWNGKEVLEIGYLFNRKYWHQGFATEAARAVKQYAFDVLKASEVCSIIRDTNTASQNVAVRNGMKPADTMIKHYRGVDMPHTRYVVRS
ncbi:GNAT family N-acetyltransferase [uncultured Dubosiella sp.]|jgi:RimJ/RimL family protein N-acetyltransferase|uniref:GNAT family N-acetyltransferase n=1 Tax=uncultured Dubosiella sp. TaxID=1937011 RepID=UPI00208BFD39|nr:GNAT family N-acetyltransferase [uncultured Dubosiella sp.]GJM57942.1 acetyltransferase [Erysipelotrichaceae bacterium OPF54]